MQLLKKKQKERKEKKEKIIIKNYRPSEGNKRPSNKGRFPGLNIRLSNPTSLTSFGSKPTLILVVGKIDRTTNFNIRPR